MGDALSVPFIVSWKSPLLGSHIPFIPFPFANLQFHHAKPVSTGFNRHVPCVRTCNVHVMAHVTSSSVVCPTNTSCYAPVRISRPEEWFMLCNPLMLEEKDIEVDRWSWRLQVSNRITKWKLHGRAEIRGISLSSIELFTNYSWVKRVKFCQHEKRNFVSLWQADCSIIQHLNPMKFNFNSMSIQWSSISIQWNSMSLQ